MGIFLILLCTFAVYAVCPLVNLDVEMFWIFKRSSCPYCIGIRAYIIFICFIIRFFIIDQESLAGDGPADVQLIYFNHPSNFRFIPTYRLSDFRFIQASFSLFLQQPRLSRSP